jgi:peptidoglycan/LPS O-acetylase OafA/YrhL
MTTQSDARPLAAGIRWWRVLGGGLLIELVLMVISVPFVAMGRADELPTYVLPATVVAAVLAGLWVARRVERPVLHGVLAGLAAILLYLAIAVVGVLVAPERANFDTALSPAYLASHVLKVLGGALGGWLVARRRS